MEKNKEFIPKSYNSNVREMIQLYIMVQSFTPQDFKIEESFEGNYLCFKYKEGKKRYAHWAHLLYGYVAHKVLKEAYDSNLFEDWDAFTLAQNDILNNQILEDSPPFEILWDLFKDIQRLYNNTNYEELLEVAKLKVGLNKATKSTSIENSELWKGCFTKDVEKKPIPLPEGEPKKIVVKGFKPSVSSNVKLLTTNISEQVL